MKKVALEKNSDVVRFMAKCPTCGSIVLGIMMTLNRRFTPISLLMLSINGIIGSAWLFAPLYAAKIAGSGAIISWLLGGFATIVIALTFAELSSLLPIAGEIGRAHV